MTSLGLLVCTGVDNPAGQSTGLVYEERALGVEMPRNMVWRWRLAMGPRRTLECP